MINNRNYHQIKMGRNGKLLRPNFGGEGAKAIIANLHEFFAAAECTENEVGLWMVSLFYNQNMPVNKYEK
jgi:hypothetical protein